MKREIHLIYFNAGGGHRSAALALQEVIATAHPEWAVSLINLFEVIDSESYYQKLTGFAPEDLYNLRLKRGWTRGLATELKLFQAMIRLTLPQLKKRMQSFWRSTPPDLVVSLVPNFNKVMYLALRDELPQVSYVTVMTDMADYPPNFWIEPGQNQYMICGTEFAVSQAHAMGYDAKRVIQTTGMILRPSFYRPQAIDRPARLAELGLDAAQPTGLVMFGGNGSNEMLKIAKELSHRQLILVAGHNTGLAKKLEALPSLAKQVVLGFTKDINQFMQLSDYFMGKPGPGSLSEAVHMGLPVITFQNSLTMPQERYNTLWVKEKKLGKIIKSVKELQVAVDELLHDLSAFKSNVQKINNRAVYEVVDAMSDILGAQNQAGAL
jgi:hypothetical protein